MSDKLMTSAELTQLRSDVEAYLMPDTCNVLSVTRTSDGQGGWTEAWGTASGTVACRLDAKAGREMDAGGAVQAFHTYTLTLKHGTTITTANRVEVDSSTFAVVSVDTAKSWDAAIRCELERV